MSELTAQHNFATKRCHQKPVAQGVTALSQGCSLLHTLDLSHCGAAVTDALITAVAAHCRQLAVVQCNGCAGWGEPGLRKLLKFCSRLTRLEFSGCTGLEDTAMVHFKVHTCNTFATHFCIIIGYAIR
jgi:predicted metal-binding protein